MRKIKKFNTKSSLAASAESRVSNAQPNEMEPPSTRALSQNIRWKDLYNFCQIGVPGDETGMGMIACCAAGYML
jgi:hypothetical protein